MHNAFMQRKLWITALAVLLVVIFALFSPGTYGGMAAAILVPVNIHKPAKTTEEMMPSISAILKKHDLWESSISEKDVGYSLHIQGRLLKPIWEGKLFLGSRFPVTVSSTPEGEFFIQINYKGVSAFDAWRLHRLRNSIQRDLHSLPYGHVR